MPLSKVWFAGLLVIAACNERDPRNEYHSTVPPRDDKSRAVRAAESFGLSNVKSVGMAGAWACSDSDSWVNSATVEGDTMAGKRIRATVCCGWIKGCTVRFE